MNMQVARNTRGVQDSQTVVTYFGNPSDPESDLTREENVGPKDPKDLNLANSLFPSSGLVRIFSVYYMPEIDYWAMDQGVCAFGPLHRSIPNVCFRAVWGRRSSKGMCLAGHPAEDGSGEGSQSRLLVVPSMQLTLLVERCPAEVGLGTRQLRGRVLRMTGRYPSPSINKIDDTGNVRYFFIVGRYLIRKRPPGRKVPKPSFTPNLKVGCEGRMRCKRDT